MEVFDKLPPTIDHYLRGKRENNFIWRTIETRNLFLMHQGRRRCRLIYPLHQRRYSLLNMAVKLLKKGRTTALGAGNNRQVAQHSLTPVDALPGQRQIGAAHKIGVTTFSTSFINASAISTDIPLFPIPLLSVQRWCQTYYSTISLYPATFDKPPASCGTGLKVSPH